MMQADENWNEAESIHLIRSMVESTRYSIYQDRFLYFMWGYLTLGVAAAHYLMAFILEMPQAYMVWIVMAFGGLVHFLYLSKRKKQAKVKTYMGRVMAGIWGGMSMAIVVLLFGAFEIGWHAVYPFFMILYGTACYATGMTLRYKALIIGGIGSTLCGFWAFYQPFQYQLLLLMLAVIVSYIIPAHLMKPKQA
ncbi:hypothetical protein [Echinicola sp. 20G]|uniref:hypothetical protein n=1 Tax=Echinicola sp. 20G TaxID=2781961 RepID=UPI0019111531|nr:hypothetical protein [Echinicola sp. 20G]